MKDSHKKHLFKLKFAAIFGTVTALVAISIAGIGYYLSDKVINVSILNNKINLANTAEAIEQISAFEIPKSISIEIDSQIYKLATSSFNLELDSQATADRALIASRDIKNLLKTKKVKPIFIYNSQLLEEQISLIAGQSYVTPIYPDIKFEANSPVITNGKLGYKLNNNLLILEIIENLENNNNIIGFNLEPIGSVLAADAQQNISQDYIKLSNKRLKLTAENFEKILNDVDLIKLTYGIDGTENGPFENLLEELKLIETPAINPVFTERDGRVIEFKPAIYGVEIRNAQLQSDVKKAIDKLINSDIDELEVKILVLSTEPEIKTEDVNSYGIKELIGKGHSTFRGSIPSRVHNVGHAASKMTGILIAPNETFSFNELIGDISEITGFKQSYIIKEGQTMLGDGGGVCQVSTTIFRAALESGLEIIERNPHSYRVGYYEQGSPPGIDATIYHPTVDFQFKNNTDNYVLIQAVIDVANRILDIEFFGTKDGRVVEIGKPVVSEVIEPPEDLYIDDPTKPIGHIEQIDFKAWGAKVYFDYKVTKDDEVLQEKRFYSNYQPWQAKFIRGTGQ